MNRRHKCDAEAVSAVQIRNLQRKTPIKLDLLQRFAQQALTLCQQKYAGRRGKDGPREVSILLISDRRMASLHKRFLNQSGPTDVITFHHGEIFISIPTALRQAKRFGNSVTGEIKLYIVHGFLHLHGFKDGTAQERQSMRKAERTVLRRLSV